jgi:hypothetical protein
MFGELPDYGYYVHHAQSLTLKNVRISTKGAYYHLALVFDAVQQLTLQQVNVFTALTQPMLVRNDVTGSTFKQVSVSTKQ